MKLRSWPVAITAALVLFIVAGGTFLLLRPAEDTCFNRLGGPGPNSNTSRLNTTLEVPADQWPAVAQIMREFAAARGWLLSEEIDDHPIQGLDMCDHVTIVRAGNEYGEGRRIGFQIIHMNYEGPARDGWQAHYRELHRRLEARWPGRMSYIEGEFGRPITRPAWLDAPAPASAPAPAPTGNSAQ